MNLTPISGSTAITHAGYDATTQTLTLQFKGVKAPSVIEGVSPATFQEFLNAPSKGRFFHERLKP